MWKCLCSEPSCPSFVVNLPKCGFHLHLTHQSSTFLSQQKILTLLPGSPSWPCQIIWERTRASSFFCILLHLGNWGVSFYCLKSTRREKNWKQELTKPAEELGNCTAPQNLWLCSILLRASCVDWGDSRASSCWWNELPSLTVQFCLGFSRLPLVLLTLRCAGGCIGPYVCSERLEKQGPRVLQVSVSPGGLGSPQGIQKLSTTAVGHPLPSQREWDQEANLAENQHWKMQIAGCCFSSPTWFVMVLQTVLVQCQCQCKRRYENHSSTYLGGVRGGCSCPVWHQLNRCAAQMLSLWRSYGMVCHPPGEPICPVQGS